jgi:hypothetical protein
MLIYCLLPISCIDFCVNIYCKLLTIVKKLWIRYFHIMVQIVYNIYFEIDEYHPIKGQLSFILLVYMGLLLGTHSMEAPSQQQPS